VFPVEADVVTAVRSRFLLDNLERFPADVGADAPYPVGAVVRPDDQPEDSQTTRAGCPQQNDLAADLARWRPLA
jgi:hypothetical protein